MNISDYIKKYGNKTFLEKPFNEIDNIIFSCLAYVNLEGIVSSGAEKKRLEEVAELYFSINSKKENKQNITAVRYGIEILYEVWHTKRFRDVLLFFYLYIGNSKSQFSAISFEYLKGHIYIAYEGTDELLSGWEEDFKIAYEYPVTAQKYASRYLIKNYLFSFDNLILGGHSKGGHLAVVAAMEAPSFIFNRIDVIYCNDGLGLRKEEFNSRKYQKIKSKIIEIIPDYSIVGVLLYQDSPNLVIKSKVKGLFAHHPRNWIVEDDHLLDSEQSKFSIVLDQGMKQWLDTYTKEEKENFARSIFDLAREYEFTSFLDFKNRKLDFVRMITSSKNIDEKTKEMLQKLILILFQENKDFNI